jgi:hypothetical protein
MAGVLEELECVWMATLTRRLIVFVCLHACVHVCMRPFWTRASAAEAPEGGTKNRVFVLCVCVAVTACANMCKCVC